MILNKTQAPWCRGVAGVDQNLPEVGRAAVNLLHSLIVTGERGIPPIRTCILQDATWVPDRTAGDLGEAARPGRPRASSRP